MAAPPRTASAGGGVIGTIIVILVLVALASGGHHLHFAAGGSGNGNGGAVHTSARGIPGDPCLPGQDQNKLVARFSQTQAGEIFLKCAAWRHFIRRHPVRDGADARQILKCIEETIYRGAYSFYTKGANGHPPAAIFDWQWGESWQWTRVITSLPQPGEPVYLISAYVNNNREAAATGRGGSWKDCAGADS